MPTPLTLSQLTDLALGTPEVGAVNFNCLHVLLHAIISKLQIQDAKAEIDEADKDFLASRKLRIENSDKDSGKGDDSEDALSDVNQTGSPSHPISSTATHARKKKVPYHQLELRVEELAEKIEQLNSLPSSLTLMEQTSGKTDSNGRPVADMWQMLQLKKKVDTNEEGINKLCSLIEDMMKEIQLLKDSRDDILKKIKHIDLKDLERKLSELEQQNKDLRERFNLLPGPDDFKLYVTWPLLEDALRGLQDAVEAKTIEKLVVHSSSQTDVQLHTDVDVDKNKKAEVEIKKAEAETKKPEVEIKKPARDLKKPPSMESLKSKESVSKPPAKEKPEPSFNKSKPPAKEKSESFVDKSKRQDNKVPVSASDLRTDDTIIAIEPSEPPSGHRMSSSSTGPSKELLEMLEKIGKLSEDHEALQQRITDIEREAGVYSFASKKESIESLKSKGSFTASSAAKRVKAKRERFSQSGVMEKRRSGPDLSKTDNQLKHEKSDEAQPPAHRKQSSVREGGTKSILTAVDIYSKSKIVNDQDGITEYVGESLSGQMLLKKKDDKEEPGTIDMENPDDNQEKDDQDPGYEHSKHTRPSEYYTDRAEELWAEIQKLKEELKKVKNLTKKALQISQKDKQTDAFGGQVKEADDTDRVKIRLAKLEHRMDILHNLMFAHTENVESPDMNRFMEELVDDIRMLSVHGPKPISRGDSMVIPTATTAFKHHPEAVTFLEKGAEKTIEKKLAKDTEKDTEKGVEEISEESSAGTSKHIETDNANVEKKNSKETTVSAYEKTIAKVASVMSAMDAASNLQKLLDEFSTVDFKDDASDDQGSQKVSTSVRATNEKLKALGSELDRQLKYLKARFGALENDLRRLAQGVEMALVRSRVSKSHLDSQTLTRAQQAILQLQNELDRLHATTQSIIAENLERTKDIENLLAYCDRLQETKIDKEYIAKELDVKADKRQLEAKVNHSLFDSATADINNMIKDIIKQLAGHEEDWKRAYSQLSDDIDNKLDRLELDPLKEWLEARLKALSKKIQQSMGDQWGEDEAAGLRKQLLQRFHCLSCDRPVDIAQHGPVSSIPAQPGMPATRSPRPYTTYELDQIRQHAKKVFIGRHDFLNAGKLSFENQIMKMRGHDLKAFFVHFGSKKDENAPPDIYADYYATARQCGGSHTMTYPHKRTTRLSHLSNLFKEEEPAEVPVAIYKEEVDVQGVDGHIYKGRVEKLEAKLPPTIPTGQTQQARNMKPGGGDLPQMDSLSPRPGSRPSSRNNSRAISRPNSFTQTRPTSARQLAALANGTLEDTIMILPQGLLTEPSAGPADEASSLGLSGEEATNTVIST